MTHWQNRINLDFDSDGRVTIILPDGTKRERQISDLGRAI